MYPIIVVDDEPTTSLAIKDYIATTNKDFFVAATFTNAPDALTYLQQNPVNVVIADICMPEMDGLEMSAFISENYPQISIIIISGYGEFEYARRAIEYGVSSYFLKPFDFNELGEKLKSIADQLNIMNTAGEPDEDVQIFFTNLLNGTFSSLQEMNTQFSQLPLTGSPKDYTGYILHVDLKDRQLNNYNYEKETLSSALRYCLSTVYTGCAIYYLYRIGTRYCFVLLYKGQRDEISLSAGEDALRNLLNIKCGITVKTTFDNLHAIRPAAQKRVPEDPRPNKTNSQYVERAMAFIQAHYSQDITREDVADAIHLAPVYFGHLFKKSTGQSFMDYLTTVRMKKAIELLETKMKISDISKNIGYQSRNRFYINFRNYTGYAPTEYRKQVLKVEMPDEKNED